MEVVFSQQAELDLEEIAVGLPWFRGQVDRSHAMTLRLFIDDQSDQD